MDDTVFESRTQKLLSLYERFADSKLGDDSFEKALSKWSTSDAWSETARHATNAVSTDFLAWCTSLPAPYRIDNVTDDDVLIVYAFVFGDMFGEHDRDSVS